MVTTVGYGDSISTPNYTDHSSDYANQLAFMMIGVLIFRFNQASMTQFINRVLKNPYSIEERQSEHNAQIESYFSVHNQILGPTFLEFKQLENWKY